MFKSLIFSLSLLSAGSSDGFMEPLTDSLRAVTITADKGVVVSRTDTLSVTNSFNISDVLHQSPGLYVGDNGGPGGLKTVSLRGLGSAHTTVYIDGVRVGNVQSGQNDLGMTGFEDYESVVVDYAQNSISLNTARPVFSDSPVAGTVRMNVGSFDTWQPSARFDFRLKETLSLSVNAAGIISQGDFGYGEGAVRVNNDLKQIRAGLDLFGKVVAGEYHVKAYYNASKRGTPGSVDWPSDDRQEDANAFIQGTFCKNFSPLYTMMLSAKGSYDDIFYTSTWGDSRYGQTEVQFNSVHDFQIRRWWKLSLAANIQWDDLNSTVYKASRITAFSALASSFRTGRLSADIALEYNGAYDKDAMSRNSFAPSADVRFTAFKGFDVIAFARRAYRVPTFNELYYVGYGNPDLMPEDAWLTDLGVEYIRSFSPSWSIKTKLDGFYNILKDKITSAPTVEDPNIWSPYNIGKVIATGFDVALGFVHSGRCGYSVDAKYTFMSAVDKTEDSYTFGQQIPYISRHTFVLNGNVNWRGWSLGSLWQLRAGRTDSAGDMPSWNTLDVTLSKSISFDRVGTLLLKFSARNMLDCRYETVSGYPMPGRNFIGGLEFKF